MRSGADVIAFATAGGDTVNLIKQASEFGLKQKGSMAACRSWTTTNDIQIQRSFRGARPDHHPAVLLGPE